MNFRGHLGRGVIPAAPETDGRGGNAAGEKGSVSIEDISSFGLNRAPALVLFDDRSFETPMGENLELDISIVEQLSADPGRKIRSMICEVARDG